MKQRTVTIISTLLNPRLLVADEPTSALDVTSQKILIEMLLEMLEKRIMSRSDLRDHDLPVLRTAANRIAVMYQGKIVELGPTEIVVERPEHPYTQALMSFGAGAGTGLREYQNRGHEQLRPLPLRRSAVFH
jgi:peptide/nickel transport system ATP-binding protein